MILKLFHSKKKKDSEEQFNNEIKYTVLASKMDVGPKTYSSYICNNVDINNGKLKWDLY